MTQTSGRFVRRNCLLFNFAHVHRTVHLLDCFSSSIKIARTMDTVCYCWHRQYWFLMLFVYILVKTVLHCINVRVPFTKMSVIGQQPCICCSSESAAISTVLVAQSAGKTHSPPNCNTSFPSPRYAFSHLIPSLSFPSHFQPSLYPFYGTD